MGGGVGKVVLAVAGGWLFTAVTIVIFQREILFPVPIQARLSKACLDKSRMIRIPLDRGGLQRPAGVGSAVLALYFAPTKAGEPEWKLGDVPAANSSERPVTIVFFHANADQLSWGACRLGPEFASRGIGFLAVEYPGYGISLLPESEEHYPTEAGILFTAEQTLDIVTTENPELWCCHGHDLVFLGQSLGSAVAVAMAASPARPESLVGVVLLSPFESIPKVARATFPFLLLLDWFSKDPFNSEAKIEQMNPLDPLRWMVMHGTADEVVPFEQARSVADKIELVTEAQVLVEPLMGVGHNVFGSRANDVYDLVTRFVHLVRPPI